MQTPYDVELDAVSVTLGNRKILQDITFTVGKGELVTLLGPSGCGKSTTLNIIAGFLDPDAGEVRIKGRRMNGVPPHRRGLGMVFQSYSLFPHMTVAENVEYGLRLRKIPPPERRRRVEQALALVRMEEYGRRYPRELSGGQRQRVAIARALVVEPELLLLDEPLSNLDAKLRQELRLEIKRLQHEVGVTTIFVTHDQEEALSLSDRIIVMNEGRIEQIGTPTEVYWEPATEFVFTFIGKSNVLLGKVEDARDGGRSLAVRLEGLPEASRVWARGRAVRQSLPVGQAVKLYLRPERIHLSAGSCANDAREPGDGEEAKGTRNRLAGRVIQMNFLGAGWEVLVETGGTTVLVQAVSLPEGVAEGSEVCLEWPADGALIVKR
ncbi:MAG: ABC transporter ATP-binding protein [Hydrogenibacillus schlegelii]|uniref:Carnitine transport ATP-binding protein OpuCA n=1 Tax=Hydrogenibacillus schlegelii TaxID=1484 RepID=A0A947D097_HYDSH|nr:ABC transporter ATP-binding protein [Hydrogenibacillus schlegelii]